MFNGYSKIINLVPLIISGQSSLHTLAIVVKAIIYIIIFTFPICALAQKEHEPIWWEMERNGKYLEVASYLLYKNQSDSTRNRHADFLHIARSYGYMNDYEKASFYWRKSVEGMKPEDDEQFWWYYMGTLAFFERDKEKLFEYMNLLRETHSEYYANNSKTLESLYEKFDRGYKEASNWKE